jgi:protein phosphatase
MLEAHALTDPGKVRTSNQDCFRIVPELGLFLLADGMGGARGGERASRLTVDAVADVISRTPGRDAATLLAAVEEANRRVHAEASADPRLDGMGTTLVAALETGENDLAIASVGDSRAYLLHAGHLKVITQDQTWVQEVGRPLGLDEETLRKHPMRHVLTMAVGVGSNVRVRYYAVQLALGDMLMICSDGLHGVVSEAQVEEILTAASPLEQKCTELVNAAHASGSPDNVTVLLIRAA